MAASTRFSLKLVDEDNQVKFLSGYSYICFDLDKFIKYKIRFSYGYEYLRGSFFQWANLFFSLISESRGQLPRRKLCSRVF